MKQPHPPIRVTMEMKPAPAPHVPGNAQAERFGNAVRKMFSVSNDDLAKQEERWKRGQARKKRAKRPA